MSTVVIVDYGLCNLDSVARAVEECGGTALVSDKPEDVQRAARIILPGVGSFPDAMRNLRRLSLDTVLRKEAAENDIPLLGICLGMQLLATKGWEFEETQGLGLIPGEVRRLEPSGEDRRIPHIGWNEVEFDPTCPLFEGIDARRDFYFLHSYHLIPTDPGHAVARTPYGKGFASAVQNGRVFGTQFHPEKSQKAGLRLIRNFLAV